MNIGQSAVNALLVPIYHWRESKGTESIDSQQLRTTAAIENVLRKDAHFQGITIEPYTKIFISRQVNRDEVLSDIAISDLLDALEDNLPDLPESTPRPTNKKTIVWIMAVSLLRFGKKKEQLQAIVDTLKGISDKLEVEIMPLDCFGIPMDRAIPILTDYIDGLEKISREIGTNRDQGKYVMADAHSQKEQSYVTSEAKVIKRRLEQGDVKLKAMIERGLNFVKVIDSAEGTLEGTVESDGDAKITNITIVYTMGPDKFVEKYLEALKKIKASPKIGEELSSFIKEEVKVLARFVHEYKGKKLTGMYFRISHASRTLLCFGVPKDQFTMSASDMKFHHPDIEFEERNIAIFFDYLMDRSALTNPEFISYLAALIAGAFDDVYISQPNRIGQDAAVVALHEAACTNSGTVRHFTKAIGKDVDVLTEKEENRSKALKKAKKDFNDRIEQCRNEYLPRSANVDAVDAGSVTYELSKAMKVVGSSQLSKEEKAKNGNNDGQNRGNDSDQDSIGSDCMSEYGLSESESDDEEEEETDHAMEQY
mmetsp:Transcript_29192/g.43863  ORF Transcript_29192/g.43863 Transcript_29192/m.43863 type:complete len:538 (-) Transcript_29192:64-1677(-)